MPRRRVGPRPARTAVSMGTSDTVFGSLADPKPSAAEGHIFVNPVEPEAYMAMVVRKNGSLTREQMRDRLPGASWKAFEAALRGKGFGQDGEEKTILTGFGHDGSQRESGGSDDFAGLRLKACGHT